MIPFNFIYCRPDTIEEAHRAFIELSTQGRKPLYYGGGSEIITMSRMESIRPGAVIDIKRVAPCMLLAAHEGGLDIGSGCTLNQIKESGLFPLLSLACGRIADHTNQCRITLGGNLCGTIIYRETSLPLLLCDADVTIMGGQGLRRVPFSSVFDGRMRLMPGELVVGLHVPKWALCAPHFHVKRTTNEKIDYPLVSMAAIRAKGGLRVAFSGVCSYPFRSLDIEGVLGDLSLSKSERVEKAAGLLPEPPCNDVEGDVPYRLFVFKNTLAALLEEL